jgi:hypothetical protein
MAITYGFFNSLNGDRTYDADQMSEYFDGLVSNGVYESVGGGLQVLAVSEGMAVNVSTGRALINCKWLNNSAVLTLDITSAHAILNRWTAVIVRLDIVNRLMTITTKDGTPATDPVKPPMQSDASMIEMCLAYVYVAADSGSISQADITDMRGSNLCGWVTGLIEQVDTATLFLQWQTAFNNYYQQMTSAFNDWFNTLTDELQVNTFIQKFSKKVIIAIGVTNEIALDMVGYTYDGSDIIHVYVNGLNDVDYTLDTSGAVPTVTVDATAKGTEIYIEVLKSKVGFNILSDGTNPITTDSNEEIIV